MDRHSQAALAALLAGLGLLAYAALSGELRAGLFLFVPFVVGSGPASLLGILALSAALLLHTLGRMRQESIRGQEPREPPALPHGEHPPTRHGGVLLLGPLPIVWGSDRRILPWMVGAGLALLLLALALSLAL